MFKIRNASLVTAAAMVVGLAASAQAAVIASNDFETGTLIPTADWTYSGTGGNAGSATAAAAESGSYGYAQPMNSTTTGARLSYNPTDVTLTSADSYTFNVKFSSDFALAGTNTPSVFVLQSYFTSLSSGSPGTQLRVTTSTTDTTGNVYLTPLMRTDADSGNTYGTPITLTRNKWYTVTLTHDFANSKVSLSVNDSVTNSLVGSATITGTNSNQTTFDKVYFGKAGVGGTSPVPTGTIYLDNFAMTTTPVPEPASAMMLLGGGSLLMLRRRRKQ